MTTDHDEVLKDSECGASHDGCPNTPNGSCDRESGHSGSHHCSACGMQF
jgi:hypothetical protein